MKKLIFVLPLLFCASHFYGDDGTAQEEIALLEPTFFPQQPPTHQPEVDLASPNFAPRHKSPFLAVSLSFLCPGLGHTYLGDYVTAGSLFGSVGLLATLDSTNLISDEFRSSNQTTLQNTWFYNIYAAYRDVRAYNNQMDDPYKMPTESFADLAWSPFQWSVMKKPEVWGGVLGALTVGAGISYLAFAKDKESHLNLSPKVLFPLLAFPVGIGEESFFRGFLQPSLYDSLTPWGSIAVSSLAFGAVHLVNGLAMEPEQRMRYYSAGIPFITSFGIYLGWLTYKNGSLKESVALHSWYDFVLFLASYSAMQSAAIGKPSFAISIPF